MENKNMEPNSMSGLRLQEFLEDLRDVAFDEKIKKKFKNLGEDFFKTVTESFASHGYTDVDYYFYEGHSDIGGDHIFIVKNPRTKKGVYMSLSLYFNSERKLLIRGIRSDGLQTKNRHLRLTDFCKPDILIKSALMIIEKDCSPENRPEV